jgi:RNA polymerase sigma-70 factor (ECF subfamily)
MDAARPVPDAGLRIDPEPFAEILRLHQGRVRAYLRRWVLEPDVADDLAQETFLAAYRSLPRRNPAAPVELWLLGIARHRALKHLRDEARRRGREARPLRVALSGWSAARLESGGEGHEEEVSALKQCLAGLPRESAGLISAYYYERKSSADIARRTGRKESAVRMTLLRLREALRQCVAGRKQGAEAGA